VLWAWIYSGAKDISDLKPVNMGILSLILLHVICGLLSIQPISAFFPAGGLIKDGSHQRQHTYYFSGSSSEPLFAKSGTKKKRVKGNGITVNKLAYRNYEILETLEAGISLKGTEVKSIRDGKMNIRDGYCKTTKTGQCTLHNVHIGKHSHSGAYFQHEELRIRPILIRKAEARKFNLKAETPGITVVPLKAYFSDDNKVKFLIGLAKGKNNRDKRKDIQAREEKRDIGRMMKSFNV
jgi:SsrA-binding protein